MIPAACGAAIGAILALLGIGLLGVGHGTAFPLLLVVGPAWPSLWASSSQSPLHLLIWAALLYWLYGWTLAWMKHQGAGVKGLLGVLSVHYCGVFSFILLRQGVDRNEFETLARVGWAWATAFALLFLAVRAGALFDARRPLRHQNRYSRDAR